jgi:glycosyltransferase involved in cell wall biosynthesis
LAAMNLIAFLNAYSQGYSGSDVRFLEIFNRINKQTDLKLVVVTSKLGKEFCEQKSLNAKFALTSKENKFGSVLLTYTRRIISAFFMHYEVKRNTVLYATSDFLPDVLPILFLKLRYKRVKWVQVIHHVQGSPFTRVGRGFLVSFLVFLSQRLSFRLAKRRCDLTIIVNPLIRSQLKEIGFDEEKIFVNYNGVNLEKIRSIGRSEKKYDGVFLGRINYSKGVFDLVKTWSAVVKEHPKAKLAIIGRGDSKIEKILFTYASRLNLSQNIDFLGYLDEVKAFGILKSAKTFLFPSYEEGFGIAILEAMACGLPIVTYNLPAYKEIYGDRLITVPLGRTDLMSQHVCYLLENANIARTVGDAGMELVKEYDWGKIAQREMLLIERNVTKVQINYLAK